MLRTLTKWWQSLETLEAIDWAWPRGTLGSRQLRQRG
jgi:hypothetical protein